jgi:DNA-binding NarL/FixJ family response regulator
MKIRDIVTEAPGVLASIKQDYNKGYDAVDKVLNPKRWGETDKPSAATASTASVDTLDFRDALNAAASGKQLYNRDVDTLKQAYSQIKAGTLEIKQDSAQVLVALKTAIGLQKLNPQQRQLLIAVAKDL